jgi:hypothetical protein
VNTWRHNKKKIIFSRLIETPGSARGSASPEPVRKECDVSTPRNNGHATASNITTKAIDLTNNPKCRGCLPDPVSFPHPPAQAAQRFCVTHFDDEYAKKLTVSDQSLNELRELVLGTTAREKKELPWLKLARFGSKRTDANCLRNDDNVLDISGVELDYDGKQMPFEEAVVRIKQARLHALLYTSPSHTPAAPKWRVVAPVATERHPADRAKLLARLNGVLGGVASEESFTLSQSYYFGSVNNNPDHLAVVVEGDPIDLRDDLDVGAIGKTGKTRKLNGNGADPDEQIPDEEHIARIISGENFHRSLLALAARHIVRGNTPETTIETLQTLMDRSTAPQDARWHARYDAIPETVASAVEFAKRKATEEPATLDGRPVMKVGGGRLSDLADQAETLLIEAGVQFYERSNRLARPIVKIVDTFHGRKTSVAQLARIDTIYARDMLCRIAVWVRFDIRSKTSVRIDPPADVAATMLARAGEWAFPSLAGIVTTQTMRPDGTIFSEPGYDPATRLLLIDPPPMPPIPETPTRDDAEAALALLTGLLAEFPLVGDVDRAMRYRCSSHPSCVAPSRSRQCMWRMRR